jgi:hypothetical protein
MTVLVDEITDHASPNKNPPTEPGVVQVQSRKTGVLMITFQVTADVKQDRQVVLTLPPEVPTGQTKLVVSVEPSTSDQAQIGLLDWVEAGPILNGNGQSRYPLRGSVVRYEQPTEPVAEEDWESAR